MGTILKGISDVQWTCATGDGDELFVACDDSIGVIGGVRDAAQRRANGRREPVYLSADGHDTETVNPEAEVLLSAVVHACSVCGRTDLTDGACSDHPSAMIDSVVRREIPTTRVVTWQSNDGAELDLCETHSAEYESGALRMRYSPRGQAICQISHGLHRGSCDVCAGRS